MRSEKEMYDLILSVARKDERIYAVYMNGSRTNRNAKKDIFQDYDIVYVVGETKSFRKDKKWIDKFGKRLYMQYPEENISYESDIENCYGWLIQFADGNRLDLHVCTLKYVHENIHKDKLCRILLDKNKCLPDIVESTDKDYWIKKPTDILFYNVCNEFWWCLNNVAKGLWREEVPYAMDMINHIVRPQLIDLMKWKVGFKTNFSVNAGKSAKYIDKWLEKDEYSMFLKTYSSSNIKDIWESVFIMCDLFNKIAYDVSDFMKIKYDKVEANNSFKFLKDVYRLPKDAKKIY